MIQPPAPTLLGVSLKMYFGHAQTVSWCREVARMAADHPALRSGETTLFILPSFPALVPAGQAFAGGPVQLGAQDLHWEDMGPFTGEVSGAQLHEAGCRYVEVGHAERRLLFGEDDRAVAAKTVAAQRNSLIPVICVGEEQRLPAEAAAEACTAQLAAAVAEGNRQAPIVVAYEPVWAIGSREPASTGHIRTVCARLKTWLAASGGFAEYRVIYGGSAGPGLLTRLGPEVDGLFLGRFAHDVGALSGILAEAAARGTNDAATGK
ncbi:triose-phosphate isomerase family protein [Arthrobacter mangrovi]|uniref:Triosephosphate isomerase n=1 Tax=Arthrobacter mangrovi TaxID=2966350 RepID=A0ABQ5MUS0_9MICC|nr:triose-phosphate isomerase family protein [Arthrobacter mangrovi]GLB67540.1 triosephosphate isomerase [Arthrobacter mangrovi]